MQLAFSSPVVCPTLIGRTAELSALRLLIERAKSGKGQVALLSGEAGVGKSRLVAEVKTHATSQGFLPLQGNCFWADRAFPYAPLYVKLCLSPLDKGLARRRLAPLRTAGERLRAPHGSTV